LIKKYFLLSAGFISLGLGMIGIITPVLPTTPFLLLSSYCFIRSSERWYNWLIHHKIFGAYIYNYIKYKAVTKKTKISALIFLWVSLSVSIILINNIQVRIILFIVGAVVSVHILLLKTLTRRMIRETTEEINGRK
jgi:uncharacterized membrane protein YbaN (DUF454 family)